MKFNIQNRVIPFVLSLTLLLLFVFPVSVSAAETSIDGSSVSNLLTSTSYTAYVGGSSNGVYENPGRFFSGNSSYGFGWYSSYAQQAFKYVYLTVSLSRLPSSVTFQAYDGASLKTGTLISHNGTVAQYRFTVDSAVTNLKITFKWTSTVSVTINILSCYGVNDYSDTISSGVGITLQGLIGGSTVQDVLNFYSYSSVTVPFSYEHFSVYTDSALYGVIAQIKFTDTVLPYTYSPVISVNGSYLGWFDSSRTVNARVLDSSGALVLTVPVDFSASQSSAPVIVDNRDFVKYLFTATIDLSGLDLTGCSVVLDVPFDPVSTASKTGFNFTVDSIFTSPPAGGVPWWVTLGRWLYGGLTSVKTAVTSGFDGLKSFMSDLWGAGSAGDDLISGSGDLNNQVGNVQDFEDSQIGTLDQNMDVVLQGADLSAFAASLAFVSGYAGKIFNGVSQYSIVFLLPVFLGIFFYICSRPFKLPSQRSEPEMTISRSETWVTSESQKSGNQRVTHTTTVSHHYPKEEVH